MIFIQSYHWNHTEKEKQNNLANNYTFNTNTDTKKWNKHQKLNQDAWTKWFHMKKGSSQIFKQLEIKTTIEKQVNSK